MTATLDNQTASTAATKPLLVDTDVHPSFVVPRDILPRLDEHWVKHIQNQAPRGAGSSIPRITRGHREDTKIAGIPPGSDLGILQQQLMDEYDIDYGILIPFFTAPPGPGPFDAAYNRAVNIWQREDWMDKDQRLRGSIRIPYEFPELAVAEIEYWKNDPGFVQVQVSDNPRDEWGDEKYWPIYEAAEAVGLPLMAHVGGSSQYTGAGSPSFYIEQHIYVQMVIERIATSMICAGVFEAFPKLQFSLIEACVAWAGPLCWAMDAQFEQLRGDVPNLKAKPSEYLRNHFYFSTQPIEEPDDPRHLIQMYEMTGMTDRIMFSSDYPHWDFDSPLRALPAGTPRELRDKIMGGNAMRFYGLGEEAAVSS